MPKAKPKTIDDLAAAPYNPRKISKAAAQGLSKSLTMFEDVSGIVWNKRTGHLVTGHQRVEQLRELGAKLVDGALVVGKKRWPVRVVDWPISKEKAANVAANNPHVAGDFSDGLGDILADIKLSIGDEDFAGLCFDDLGKGLTKEVEQDEVPEPPKNPVTKLGDVWTLGRHRLVCGDSSGVVPDAADLMVLDPPFDQDYSPFLVPPSTSVVMSFGRGSSRIIWEAARLSDWGLHEIVVTGGVRGWPTDSLPCLLHDVIHMWRHPKSKFKKFDSAALGESGCETVKDGKRPLSVQTHTGGVLTAQHGMSWSKPVMWFALACAYIKKDETVWDPCAGSGSSLLAAEQTDRIWIGYESQPKWCDLTVDRWQTLTGGKAKRKAKRRG